MKARERSRVFFSVPGLQDAHKKWPLGAGTQYAIQRESLWPRVLSNAVLRTVSPSTSLLTLTSRRVSVSSTGPRAARSHRGIGDLSAPRRTVEVYPDRRCRCHGSRRLARSIRELSRSRPRRRRGRQ